MRGTKHFFPWPNVILDNVCLENQDKTTFIKLSNGQSDLSNLVYFENLDPDTLGNLYITPHHVHYLDEGFFVHDLNNLTVTS